MGSVQTHPDWGEVLRRYDIVRYQLTMRYRWARRTLRNLSPVQVSQGTLAVDRWLRLYLNPDYVMTLSRDQLYGAIWHEVNHMLRNHPGRLGHALADEGPIVNVAGDLEINQDLTAQGVTLPEGVVQVEQFGYDRGHTAEEYLAYLRADQPPPQQGDGQPGDQQGQGTPQQGQGSPQQGQGQPQPGQGQGQGQPDQSGNQPSDAGDSPSEGEGGGDPQPKFGDGCGSAAGNPHPEELDAPDKNEQSRLNRDERGQAQDIVEEVESNGYSEVGVATYESALERIGRTKVDWRRECAVEIRRAIEQVTDEAEEYTFRRPSRRQAAVQDEGILLPGSYRPIPDLRAVCDVSGSMDAGKLRASLRELSGVLERLAIPEFTAYAYSTKLEATVSIRTVKDIETVLSTHGGGTNMVNGVQHAKAEGAEVILVMTDGECSWSWLDEHPEMGPLIICGINRSDRHTLPSYARVIDVTTDAEVGDVV